MSDTTLQKAWEAAKRFVDNPDELPKLVEAIKEHRSAQVAETGEDPGAADTPSEPPKDAA